MPETRTAPAEAPPGRSPGLFARAGSFLLVLGGTIGSGVSHWFIVWLIAATYGAAARRVLRGPGRRHPAVHFLGLGLRNVYVSWPAPALGDVPALAGGRARLAFALLAVYCLIAAPYWGSSSAWR